MADEGEKIYTISEAKRLRFPLVYGLCGLDGAVFYVGQTMRPDKRFQTHREGKSANRGLRERVATLGGDLRVMVLVAAPTDINAAEREEIRKREGSIVNLALAGNWSWSKHSDVPWSAGRGTCAPMQYAMLQVRPCTATQISASLRGRSLVERCWMELEMLAQMAPVDRAKFRKWWAIVEPKMRAILGVDLSGVATAL